MSKVRFPNATGAKTDKGMDIIQWSEYYPAESVERLVEAARHSKAAIDNYVHKEWGIQELQESYDKLRAALEPFNK